MLTPITPKIITAGSKPAFGGFTHKLSADDRPSVTWNTNSSDDNQTAKELVKTVQAILSLPGTESKDAPWHKVEKVNFCPVLTLMQGNSKVLEIKIDYSTLLRNEEIEVKTYDPNNQNTFQPVVQTYSFRLDELSEHIQSDVRDKIITPLNDKVYPKSHELPALFMNHLKFITNAITVDPSKETQGKES